MQAYLAVGRSRTDRRITKLGAKGSPECYVPLIFRLVTYKLGEP